MTIPENWRNDLLTLARTACEHYKIRITTLGNKIAGDADFFPSIQKGSGCGVDKYLTLMDWFKTNLPKNKHPKPQNIINKP